MPKLILTLILLALFSPTPARAEVKVNISNNKEGSSNRVQINSNTGGVKYNSNNSYNNSTSIKIDQNGEVKEYNGSDGNVNLQSSDGKTTVSVQNNSAENKSTTSNTNINSKTNITVNSNTGNSPSPSASAEATVAGVFKDNKFEADIDTGFWERLMKRINLIFESMF